MTRSGPVLLTARDPAALRAVVERVLGAPLPWIGTDHPRLEETMVWFASSAPPEVPLRLPALRWIHSGWAGVDAWIGRPEWREDVLLTRTIGDFPERIAEYVLGYLLADALDTSRTARQQAARHWERWTPGSLAGRTMTIVGYGAVGRAVGRAARGLGLRVWGVRRGPVAAAARGEGIVGAEELDALLPESHVVVNLLPATKETDGFWGAARFARLRPGSVFVNASRGRCVDEAALLAALETGRPGRAILDVFRQEPLPPDHPFWSSGRIRVTPHLAGTGTPAVEGECFAAQWTRWLRGEPLEDVVDRARGY